MLPDFSSAHATNLANQLQAGLAELPLQLDGTQQQQLLDFVALLAKWNKVYNLTALRDPAQMVSHHLLDALAVAPAYAQAQRVLDVGAGGGVPGLVLAICWPQIQFTLNDIVHKKTAFLNQAKAELGLKNVSVLTARVEQLKLGQSTPGQAGAAQSVAGQSNVQPFDVITSRAFAELADFVNWAGHLLAEGGQFIAMKGVYPEAEIAALPAPWYARAVTRIHVPQLDAERHLVMIERSIDLASDSTAPDHASSHAPADAAAPEPDPV
jgi:16S rRNA (guanine527-N7)-methyltransferase